MSIEQQVEKPWLFQAGQSGNPAGRPKGSKNKLSEHFLEELHCVFQEEGREAIQRMCREHPNEFIRCISHLVPKQLLVEVAEEETCRWVISAQPALTAEQWAAENAPQITKNKS